MQTRRSASLAGPGHPSNSRYRSSLGSANVSLVKSAKLVRVTVAVLEGAHVPVTLVHELIQLRWQT
jgi:hypothetical protein